MIRNLDCGCSVDGSGKGREIKGLQFRQSFCGLDGN